MDPRKIVRSFIVLLVFLGAGELLSWLLAVPVPGNVIGMVLLTVCLLGGVVTLEAVEPASDILLSQLGMLFIPPGVGVMLYFDLIAEEWLPLLVGTLGSLVAVLWATAIVARLLERKGAEHNG